MRSGQPPVPLSSRKTLRFKCAKTGLSQILRPFFGDFGDFADFAQLILRADKGTAGCPEQHTRGLSGQPPVPLSARKTLRFKCAKTGLSQILRPFFGDFADFAQLILRADKGTAGCPEQHTPEVSQGSPQYPYPPAKH